MCAQLVVITRRRVERQFQVTIYYIKVPVSPSSKLLQLGT